MIARHDEERDDDEERGADHQVQARAEHEVDLAHVVGGARHRVADGLQVMEGHALAEQGDIELVADIALHALRHQLGAEVAAELQDAAHDLRAADDQRQRDQTAQHRVGLEHVVEGVADQHRDGGGQRGIADGAQHQHDQDRPVAHGVRPDPAHRTAGAHGRLADEGKFCGDG